MKLFKKLLLAGTALSLIAPVASQANTVNLEEMNSYILRKKSKSRLDSKTFVNSVNKELASSKGRLNKLEAKQNNFEAGGFSDTTTATFGADFVVGAVDGDSTSEATTFDYQFGMNLSTSFTGEDSLALTIETGNASSPTGTVLDMNSMSDAMTLDGITYTFPLGDKTTVMVGDSTDVSALYSTSCVYSAFTDLLSNCGSGTAAGLGGGSDLSLIHI